jgi:propionyl-CoA carboxylase alpha chain
MSGEVMQVLVEVGQKVIEGQDLLVIEAMKAMNVIKAERDGKIKEVKVKQGQDIKTDQLLIDFE